MRQYTDQMISDIHCLGLSVNQFNLIDSVFSNDDSSSPDELSDFFTEAGIHSDLLHHISLLRDTFRINPLAQLTIQQGQLAVETM